MAFATTIMLGASQGNHEQRKNTKTRGSMFAMASTKKPSSAIESCQLAPDYFARAKRSDGLSARNNP